MRKTRVVSDFVGQCGASMQAAEPAQLQPPSPSAPSGSEPVAAIIPYKNPSALIAYYLGVFSLIPCIGFLLALAAISLGIYGLVFLKKNPQAHGAVHAWVGIVLGTLVLIGHVIVLVFAPLARS